MAVLFGGAMLVLSILMPGQVPAESASFLEEERRRILALGPWPPVWRPDPSNRFSGRPDAAELGSRLFADRRLSPAGDRSCASCHDPALRFADVRRTAPGDARPSRNTPTLTDVRWNRWFGWDGAADSLWAASLRPILSPAEMAGSAGQVAGIVRGDPALSRMLRAVSGIAPTAMSDGGVLEVVGKALAAFQETLVSGRTPFDGFRDALAREDAGAMTGYPEPARRGLRLFVGRARCVACHYGPRFTSGAFASIGLDGDDPGRHLALAMRRGSTLTRSGPVSDDTTGPAAVLSRTGPPRAEHRGLFRVPSLRGAAATAPYGHDGRFDTLADVIRHYRDLPAGALRDDGGSIGAIHLSEADIADLVAFLHSLSAD